MIRYPKNDDEWNAAELLNAEIWMFDVLKLNVENVTSWFPPCPNDIRMYVNDYRALPKFKVKEFCFSIERKTTEPAASLSLYLKEEGWAKDGYYVIKNVREDEIPALYSVLRVHNGIRYGG